MKHALWILFAVLSLSALSIRAADVDSPAAPTSPTSAMFTLEDIYNRLNAGTAGAKRTGAFVDPTAGPTATRHTLNDVMAKAPAADNTNGATAAQVLSGKTYFSLQSGAWGTSTGTMPNIGAATITPGTTAQTIAAGYHNGSGSVAGDADLISANIKSGVNIFGVSGSSSVVDTTAATAASGDVLTGKTAYVNGALVTGTVTNNGAVTITPGTTAQTIAAGYHNGSGSVAGDADLVSANIKSGVNIFGVAGSSSVVDTTAATAASGDVLTGKTAYVNGALVTGTMPNNGAVTITPGTTAQTIAAGYHNGSGSVAGDADLVSANIKPGVNIFGVTGTLAAGGAPAPIAKTGQTTSYATNDDGANQKGVASPSPRFTDNGNGTVTDNLTGLIWLKNADVTRASRNWDNAMLDVVSLNTSGVMNGNSAGDTSNGGSHQTDWRLPNVRELHSLIDFKNSNPALPTGHPFTRVLSGLYWSSTTTKTFATNAFFVNLDSGPLSAGPKTDTHNVWPVRGGQ